MGGGTQDRRAGGVGNSTQTSAALRKSLPQPHQNYTHFPTLQTVPPPHHPHTPHPPVQGPQGPWSPISQKFSLQPKGSTRSSGRNCRQEGGRVGWAVGEGGHAAPGWWGAGAGRHSEAMGGWDAQPQASHHQRPPGAALALDAAPHHTAQHSTTPNCPTALLLCRPPAAKWRAPPRRRAAPAPGRRQSRSRTGAPRAACIPARGGGGGGVRGGGTQGG